MYTGSETAFLPKGGAGWHLVDELIQTGMSVHRTQPTLSNGIY